MAISSDTGAAASRSTSTFCFERVGWSRLWGGQSCPQPPFRRLFRAVSEPSCSAGPAESRLQPGLAAPPVALLGYKKVNFRAIGDNLSEPGVVFSMYLIARVLRSEEHTSELQSLR